MSLEGVHPLSPLLSSFFGGEGGARQVHYLSKKITRLEDGTVAIKLKAFSAGLGAEKIKRLQSEKRFGLVRWDESVGEQFGVPRVDLETEWQERLSPHKITQIVFQRARTSTPNEPERELDLFQAAEGSAFEIGTLTEEESQWIGALVAQTLQAAEHLRLPEEKKVSSHSSHALHAAPTSAPQPSAERRPRASDPFLTGERHAGTLAAALIQSARHERNLEEKREAERREKAGELNREILHEEILCERIKAGALAHDLLTRLLS